MRAPRPRPLALCAAMVLLACGRDAPVPAAHPPLGSEPTSPSPEPEDLSPPPTGEPLQVSAPFAPDSPGPSRRLDARLDGTSLVLRSPAGIEARLELGPLGAARLLRVPLQVDRSREGVVVFAVPPGSLEERALFVAPSATDPARADVLWRHGLRAERQGLQTCDVSLLDLDADGTYELVVETLSVEGTRRGHVPPLARQERHVFRLAGASFAPAPSLAQPPPAIPHHGSDAAIMARVARALGRAQAGLVSWASLDVEERVEVLERGARLNFAGTVTVGTRAAYLVTAPAAPAGQAGEAFVAIVDLAQPESPVVATVPIGAAFRGSLEPACTEAVRARVGLRPSRNPVRRDEEAFVALWPSGPGELVARAVLWRGGELRALLPEPTAVDGCPRREPLELVVEHLPAGHILASPRVTFRASGLR